MAFDQAPSWPPAATGRSSLLGRSAVLLLGRGLQDTLRAGLLLWLARRDQAGLGLLVVALGLAALLRSLLSEGIDQFGLRELAVRTQGRGRVLAVLVRLKLALAGLVLAGLLGWAGLSGWGLTQTLVFFLATLAQALDALAESIFGLHRLQGRQIREAVLTTAAHSVGAAYGAAVLLLDGGLAWLAAFPAVGAGLRLALVAWPLRAAGGEGWAGPAEPVLTRAGLAGLAALVGAEVGGTLYNQLPLLLLGHFQPLAVVALYGAAEQIAGAPLGLLVQVVIGVLLFPHLVQARTEGRDRLDRAVRGYFYVALALGLALGVGLVGTGHRLLAILYGPAFVQGAWALVWLGLAAALSLPLNLLAGAAVVQGLERMILGVNLLAAGMGLAASLILVPAWGPAGAAVSVLLCRAVVLGRYLLQAQGRFRLLSREKARAGLPGLAILAAGGLAMALVTRPGLVSLVCLPLFAWWARRRWLSATRGRR
jgi:O-antigen/teichoic acid export membrane protein